MVAPPVRLWLFNHPFTGVSEQVEFFCDALRQHGYPVRVSNRPAANSLNVVIENFSPRSAATVASFCREHRKRVAVIMTEHIDFVGGQIRFHGTGIDAPDEYMLSVNKMGRLFSLLTLIEHVRCFFRLGDLPELKNFSEMVPGAPVRTIPFPLISPSDRALPRAGTAPHYELVFTGMATSYRARLLAQLSAHHRVLICRRMVSRRRRDAMNADAKLVLNLPQNANWNWISTMRVLAGLRCGRATLAIGRFARTSISPFCINIHANEVQIRQLGEALAGYNTSFERFATHYERFVRSPENPGFPHEEFDLWARLEL